MPKLFPSLILASSTLLSFSAQATDNLRCQACEAPGIDQPMLVQGNLVGTYQAASDNRIQNEGLLAFNLLAILRRGAGKWSAYIQGDTSPRTDGVSSTLVEANANAGTALDRDGKGRLQVSELIYTHFFGEDRISLGLIDPACSLDASEVANDESTQFLSSTFVNNPTIAFPDYALGACASFASDNRPGVNLVLTSSNGLADNPDRSYSELVDVGASGKGVFFGSELFWRDAEAIWRVGMWTSTGANSVLDNPNESEANYGAYLATDHFYKNIKINLRLGVANQKVSEAAAYIGLAMETTPLDSHILGAALGQTFVSVDAGPDMGNTSQAELYMRVVLAEHLHITPDVQYIVNSGFNSSGSEFDTHVMVYSIRADYSF